MSIWGDDLDRRDREDEAAREAHEDGGPAFNTPPGIQYGDGLTKRDAFAIGALSGVMALCRDDYRNCPFAEYAAMKAYEVADAMLAERSK